MGQGKVRAIWWVVYLCTSLCCMHYGSLRASYTFLQKRSPASAPALHALHPRCASGSKRACDQYMRLVNASFPNIMQEMKNNIAGSKKSPCINQGEGDTST